MKVFAILITVCVALAVPLENSQAQQPTKKTKTGSTVTPKTVPIVPVTPSKTTDLSISKDDDSKGKDDKGKKVLGPDVIKAVELVDPKKKADVNPGQNSIDKAVKLKPVTLSINDQTLAKAFRVNVYPKYHLEIGQKFAQGIFYQGKIQRHWSFCYWDPRYRCYCYWDPCVRAYYYWSMPDGCYYPVSYCPHGTYCWVEPTDGILPAPPDANAPVASVTGELAAADDGIPEATPIEPTSVDSGDSGPSALPTTLAPPPIRTTAPAAKT